MFCTQVVTQVAGESTEGRHVAAALGPRIRTERGSGCTAVKDSGCGESAF